MLNCKIHIYEIYTVLPETELVVVRLERWCTDLYGEFLHPTGFLYGYIG